MSDSDIQFLTQLEVIIAERLENPTDESYTASLAAAGSKRIAQKIGEEGVELAIAAVAGDRDEVVNEAADLLFHLLVLLADQGLNLGSVAELLQERHEATS